MRQSSEANFLPYIYTLPASASFTGKGFLGYRFGPLHNKNVEILYVESEKGHDTFLVSKKLTRVYYIVSGHGAFTLNGVRYEVDPGMLVEVPPKVEYTYSGKMNMVALCTPQWMRGNDTPTRWNPDVVRWDSPATQGKESWLTRMIRARVLGKSPVGGFLRLNQRLWNTLPSALSAFRPIHRYGHFLNSLARIQVGRAQALSTYFLRNRAELELIRRLLDPSPKGAEIKVAVLGCSTGAEAYSIAWSIRSARPDLELKLQAMDISKQAVEFAERGVYSLAKPQLVNTSIFSVMTPAEMDEMFLKNGDELTVKSWLREGICWSMGDAGDPNLVNALGEQDMIVANNFLCHMDFGEAERCLRNIARLIRPAGYLLVSGIDLDVRTKVASDLGLEPVQQLLEEIHRDDRALAARWPCHYAALEPLDKKRQNWKLRYAAAYRTSPASVPSPIHAEDQFSEGLTTAESGGVTR